MNISNASSTAVMIGNGISLAASVLMVLIGFIRKKKRILGVQCVQFGLFALANFILGGITGSITNVVSIVRNLICLKWRYHWIWKVVFIAIQVILSIFVNKIGWVGWLAVIAACSFTWFLDLEDPVKLKIVIIFGQILWAIYDYFLMNIVSCVFDIFTLVTTSVGIVLILKERKKLQNKEEQG